MQHSESLGGLATALAKAHAELDNARKTKSNTFFRSMYADLAEVLNTVNPVLASHGLSLIQLPSFDGSSVFVETILLHESGEWLSGMSGSPMPVMTKKDGTELPPSPQSVGSAISYLRRYSALAACSIATEDDDGESVVDHTNPYPDKQPSKASAGNGSAETRQPWERVLPFGNPKVKGKKLGELSAMELSGTLDWCSAPERADKFKDLIADIEATIEHQALQ